MKAKNIAIINYGVGNITSIQFAIQRLGYTAYLTDDFQKIKHADYIVFPGVGSANSAMKKLRQKQLDVLIPSLTQPVLGICLGMQLLCSHSEEGNTKGLGIFDTTVKRFSTSGKVPQVGWNTIYGLNSSIFNGITENSYFYAVHSYYVPLCKEIVARTYYDISYASALQKNNFYGVQFHPEKSGLAGEKVLFNFLNTKPS